MSSVQIALFLMALVTASDLTRAQSAPVVTDNTYKLGPEDAVVIRVLEFTEVPDTPFLVDSSGDIGVPLVGRVHVAGLTVTEVERELAQRLRRYLQEPVVTVTISSFGSRRVSVLGAVGKPGIVQIRGQKRLVELLAEAGGLSADAGNTIRISRRIDAGDLPLATATTDATGAFRVGDVGLKSLLEARDPAENIEIKPNDVVSVPRADLIYVVGSVKRAGGFPLNEREHISVLQALAMAEGLERTAAPRSARILRSVGSDARTEIAVDVRKMLAGEMRDEPLLPNDILFIPNSAVKSATMRSIEAAIQLGTGLAIWRR